MDDIRTWLNGSRNYATGVQLYLKHGKDKNLHRLFTAEAYSDFKNKKLLEALQSILASGTTPRIPAPAPVSNTDTSVTKNETSVTKSAPSANKSAPGANPPAEKKQSRWSEKMDDVEQSLFNQWNPLYAELIDLQNWVGEVSRKAEKDPVLEPEATRMALRILELDKVCEQFYSDRNYYLENKVLPETEDDLGISSNPVDWPTQLQSSKRSLRDRKLEASKEVDESRKRKLQAKVLHYQQKVAKLKKLLGKE